MAARSLERAVAFRVLRRTFEDGEFTERAFRDEVARVGLEGRNRARAQFLAFGSVQRKGTTDALLAEFGRGRPPGPAALAGIRLGLFELLFSRSNADHAIVDEAVEAVREAGESRATGFVNAILRRAIRERGAIGKRLELDGTPEECSFAHSLPVWLVRMWWEELGPDRTRSLGAAVNSPTVRCAWIDPEGGHAEETVAELRDSGVDVEAAPGAWPLACEGLFTVSGNLATAEELAGRGRLTLLSQGSAAVVEALGAVEGERALDLCSGPGTKTVLVASRVGRYGNVVAVEPDPERADDVADRVERNGFHNTLVVEADGRSGEILAEFDRVLVDAPCSDLGALASRPDARWRKAPGVIDRLVGLQAELLDRAAGLLLPGGTLVYSTCTISRRENADQVVALAARSDLRIDDLGTLSPELVDPADGRFLQLLPDRDGTTGFFIARLKKPSRPGEGR